MPPFKSTVLTLSACLVVLGACASAPESSARHLSSDIVIGCRGPYDHVMSRLLRLHADLGITPDQEFFWVAYENSYQRYADAKTFPRDVGPRDVGKAHSLDHNRDNDLSYLRREVRKARDALYSSLDASQKMYSDTQACRLSHP